MRLTNWMQTRWIIQAVMTLGGPWIMKIKFSQGQTPPKIRPQNFLKSAVLLMFHRDLRFMVALQICLLISTATSYRVLVETFFVQYANFWFHKSSCLFVGIVRSSIEHQNQLDAAGFAQWLSSTHWSNPALFLLMDTVICAALKQFCFFI